MGRASKNVKDAVEPRESLSPWLRWGLPLALFVAAFVPFTPTLDFGFVELDDDRNFFERFNPNFNERRHELDGPTLEWMFTASHFGHYQPLTWLSFGLDAQLAGFDPRVFHRTNLLLHALDAVLVYWLALLLLGAAFAPRDPPGSEGRALRLRIAAAAVGLLYAVHPLRVESVAWITERRDVLSAAFLLGSVGAYVRFATSRSKVALWMGLSLLCYVLSLLSKAWGITLPAVLLVIDLYPLRRRSGDAPASWGRLLGEKLLYAPVALLFARQAAKAQGEILAVVSLEEHGVFQRLAQACYGLLFYPLKTLWPSGLSPLYLLEPDFNPFEPVYLLAIALVVALTLALIRLRKRAPALLAAWVAYAILVSPVLGLLQSGAQLVADRYTYLAAVPLTLLLGGAVLHALLSPAGLGAARRAVVIAAVALASVSLGALTWRQTHVWRDSESVYRRVIEVEPENYFGQHSLAVILFFLGRNEEALRHARLSVAAHPGRGNAEARYNEGLLLRRLGRPEEADRVMQEALLVAPDHITLVQDQVNRFMMAGDAESALGVIERSLDSSPGFLEGYAQLARVQVARGQPALALAAWRRALSVDPGWPTANHALGLAALESGNAAEAERYLVTALGRGLTSAEIVIDLGRAYQAQGKLDQAASWYRQALALQPGNARAQALLSGLGGAGR